MLAARTNEVISSQWFILTYIATLANLENSIKHANWI